MRQPRCRLTVMVQGNGRIPRRTMNAPARVGRDLAGNSAACSFTVHVKGAGEQLADLSALVDALPIGQGLHDALRAKLDAALAALAASHTAPACAELGAFINLVQAQTGKALSLAEVSALLDAAARIREVAGC